MSCVGPWLEDEGLEDMLAPCIPQLPTLIRGISPLGHFHKPLSVLCQLIAIKPIASAIAASPRWCPPAANGRAFEVRPHTNTLSACHDI